MKLHYYILLLFPLTFITACGEADAENPSDVCSCLAYMEPVLAEQVLNFDNPEKMAELELAARNDANGKLCIELMDQESERLKALDLTQDEEFEQMEEVLGACDSYEKFKITSDKLTELLIGSMDFSEFSELDEGFLDGLEDLDSLELDSTELFN